MRQLILICFTSLPGAGKGELCQRFTTLLEIVCKGVSTLLCELAEKLGGEDAQVILGAKEKKQKVPFEYVERAVRDWLTEQVEQKTDVVVLDGFPRTVKQVEMLEGLVSTFEGQGIQLKCVNVCLQVSFEEAVRRIGVRRQKAIDAGQEPRPDDIDPEPRVQEDMALQDLILTVLHEKDFPVITVNTDNISADEVFERVAHDLCDFKVFPEPANEAAA